MPFSEHGPRPTERPEEGPSKRDVRNLTSILDIETQSERQREKGEETHHVFDELVEAIGRYDADTLSEAVRDGVGALVQEREEFMEDERDTPLLDFFEHHLNRASWSSHAIQCSVNKEVEIGMMVKKLDTLEEEADDLTTPDRAFVREVLERQLAMNAALSEVYVADILRRIAHRKQDEELMARAYATFDAQREELRRLLEAFETASPEAITQTPQLPERLDDLHAALEAMDEERFKDKVYDDIATPFSMVIGYDLEDFHEQELREALGWVSD